MELSERIESIIRSHDWLTGGKGRKLTLSAPAG